MTTCEDWEEHLTEEERELLQWHSPKAGWWMGEKRDDLCRGCSGRPIEGCVTRKVIYSLAESRPREGELVAALRHIFVTAEGQIAFFPADGNWISVRDTAALALSSPAQGGEDG